MTLVRSFGIGIAGLAALGAGLAPGLARAGWEYNESARPAKRKGPHSKPSVQAESDSEETKAPARVQVFGKGEEKSPREMTASDYAEMMKEDAAPVAEAPETAPSIPTHEEPVEAPVVQAPVAAPPVDTDASETEFEQLRNRLRTRKVAENTETEEAPKPKVAAKPRRTYIPPPPPMETETITPQKATGKKVKGSSSHSAMEPEAAPSNSGASNAAFAYTHLLPSPYTLSQGSWVFGTSVAYGVFDFFQVSTDVTRDIQKQWNVQAKVPLIDFPTFIASAFVGYDSFNPHDIDDRNPNMRVQRWRPGLVTGYELSPDTALFLGGNFNFGKDPSPVTVTSGYLSGAAINMEWSWLYNPESSRMANNALSIGLKYDTTYSLFGAGLTHHWKNFELGVHYTFADVNKFIPIFGFSAGGSF